MASRHAKVGWDTRAEFGKWFRETRLAAGVNVTEMSRELRMSPSHIHAIEKGVYGPPRDWERLEKLAKLLKVTEYEMYRAAGLLPPNFERVVEEWKSAAKGRGGKPSGRRAVT